MSLIVGASALDSYTAQPPELVTAATTEVNAKAAITVPADTKLGFTRSSIVSVAAPEPAAITFAATQIHEEQPSAEETKAAGQDLLTATAVSDQPFRLGAPLAQLSMSSPFGPRTNPLTGAADEMHAGTDFAAACNTPVVASAPGTIVEAGWHSHGGGNRVVLDHGNGLETTYNHLANISTKVGQIISTGDRVGSVGTTGSSTGCHLHFEVVVNGQPVDPTDWL